MATPRASWPKSSSAASPRRSARRSSTRRAIRSSGATSRRSAAPSSSSTRLQPTIVIGLVGEEIIVDDVPMAKADTLGTLVAPAQADRRRAHHDRARRHARRADRVPRGARRRSTPREGDRRGRASRASRTSASAASASKPRVEGSVADMATMQRLYSEAVSAAGARLGIGADRGPARRHRGADDDRRPRAGGRAEPHRAPRADDAQELRQLHVHAHGERVDPDDGPGARPGHRRPAAARVRAGRADARHRQGAHADRDPQQARQADRRRVRDHEAPHRGRRRDPARDARHPHARARRRLRAPPAHRRQRLPRRRAARRRSTSARCSAASPTSTTRCGRSAATSRRSRPSASSRC